MGLIARLAGKLRFTDIDSLLELRPDYLGFRGALWRHAPAVRETGCAGVARGAACDPRGTTEPGLSSGLA
jgi:hypothetical protein